MDKQVYINEVVVREGDFESLDEALAFIADELDFPEYFGGNLDALADCLGDTCDLTALVLVPPTRHGCAEWMRSICKVGHDIAKRNDKLKVHCLPEEEDDF